MQRRVLVEQIRTVQVLLFGLLLPREVLDGPDQDVLFLRLLLQLLQRLLTATDQHVLFEAQSHKPLHYLILTYLQCVIILHLLDYSILLDLVGLPVEEAIVHWLLVQVLDTRHVLMHPLVVGHFLGHWVQLQVHIRQTLAPLQVVQLLQTLHLVAFQVQTAQMLQEPYVEQIINVIIGDV